MPGARGAMGRVRIHADTCVHKRSGGNPRGQAWPQGPRRSKFGSRPELGRFLGAPGVGRPGVQEPRVPSLPARANNSAPPLGGEVEGEGEGHENKERGRPGIPGPWVQSLAAGAHSWAPSLRGEGGRGGHESEGAGAWEPRNHGRPGIPGKAAVLHACRHSASDAPYAAKNGCR
jgi:hypothetical protein